MGDSLVSDIFGNTAAVIADEEENDSALSTAAPASTGSSALGEPELVDTSSLTRRLARGENTQSIARKIIEQEKIRLTLPSTAAVTRSSMTSEASFEPCPRSSEMSASVKRELFQGISEEESEINQTTLSSGLDNIDVPPQTPLQQPQSTAVPSSTNSNKSALDSFSEYISFFFKNVENYEEMLERSESQRNLQASVDRKRRESRFSSPEQAGDDDVDVDMKEIMIQRQGSIDQTESRERISSPTLMLSDSMEALATVEAISNFRSLREVKKEIMDRGTPKRDRLKKQSLNDSDIGQEADIGIDIRQRWVSFCSEKKSNKFNELGLESIPLPVSVDEFYKHVLDDNAEHSIEKFMRDIGEMEVESTSWQTATPTSPTTRTTKYIHRINAPMAPPTAAARKEQTLHKFGNVGLCLETSTFVEDVPMADCFIVRDRLWVNENPAEENGCIVSITFQIEFIKGTMFRRIIENTTRGEYQKYWTQFWDMIKSNLGSSNELDEVAIELEEAALLLEAEGQEVPLSSVLGRIRSSSRRLSSVVARRASVRNKINTEEEMESSILFVVIEKGKVAGLELFTIVKLHVKEHFAEKDDSYVLGCLLILLLGMFNIMALRQISIMNRSITILTKQINEAISTNMGIGGNCLIE